MHIFIERHKVLLDRKIHLNGQVVDEKLKMIKGLNDLHVLPVDSVIFNSSKCKQQLRSVNQC